MTDGVNSVDGKNSMSQEINWSSDDENGSRGTLIAPGKEVTCDRSDSSSWSSDTPLLGSNEGHNSENTTGRSYPTLKGNLDKNGCVAEEKSLLYQDNLIKEVANTTQLHVSTQCNVTSDRNVKVIDKQQGEADNVEISDLPAKKDMMSAVLDVNDISEGRPPDPGDYLAHIDADIVKCTPINVCGSGWELGSICSMNLPSSNDLRSRIGTMDSRMVHNPSSVGAQQRLLSKILIDKIGSIEFGKGSKTDLSISFLETLSESLEAPRENKNMKNLLVLSLGITLLHIANYGLRNLQSSLNSENGLGVFSLATLCGAFMIGSLISRFVVQKYRPKICINVAILGHLTYIAANYFPKFYTIIPASILQGVGAALMWNAVCTYITEIGLNEASRKSKKSNSVLSKFFGIFFLILQFSMVLGNLISSIILSRTESSQELRDSQTTSFYNRSSFIILADIPIHITGNVSYTISEINGTLLNNTTVVRLCGAAYCLQDSSAAVIKPYISHTQKSIIIGTYSACALLAIVVIQVFLDQLPNYVSHTPSIKVAKKQIASVLGMLFDRQFCFIVLLCLYTVISNGFVVADVLKVFITCPLGMEMIGYSMICFGIMGSISSYMFGKLAKCVGNTAAFLTAAVLNVICLALMVYWEPKSVDRYLLFAFVGVWGFADGIWQSQINSVISSVFSDCYENAFGCCRVLQGAAGLIYYNMSNMFCLMTKIYFTMVTCILSVALYVVMEIIIKKSKETEIEVEIEEEFRKDE